MNWQEALSEIQSVEFDFDLNVLSGTNAFLEAVSRHPTVLEAYDLMRDTGELREEALGRLSDLVWADTDPRYENPNDTPLAVLLWLTNFAANDLAATAAGWVDQAPRCWHAKKLAQRILNPPPSMTGNVSENPYHWNPAQHPRNMAVNSMGREFGWAHMPRLAQGSRFAFPTKYSSTPDVNWGTTSVPEVEHRDGTT